MQSRDGDSRRNDDGVIDRPRAVEQTPPGFGREPGGDGNGARCDGNINRDLRQPRVAVRLLNGVHLHLADVRAINQDGSIAIPNGYVRARFNRVEMFKGLYHAVVRAATATERNQ